LFLWDGSEGQGERAQPDPHYPGLPHGKPTRAARQCGREGSNTTLYHLQRSNVLLEGGDLRRILRLYGLNTFRGMALQVRPECLLEHEARLVVFTGCLSRVI